FTYAWSVMYNGQAADLSGITTDQQTFSAIATDNGEYVVSCTVTDKDGASVTVSTDPLTVTNVDPTGTISGEPDGNINEGDPVTLMVTPADAGTDDTFTYSWSVTKNGEAFELPDDAVTNGDHFTFATDNQGEYVATCVITDDDGGSVEVSSQTITAV